MKPRFVRALRAAAAHLLISLLVVSAVAALAFGGWYPQPFRELAGGSHLFWIIAGVDVVCGPLLTLVVFDPAKLRRELVLDLALVACIQLLALAYGLFSLSQARPLALVYEVDRFRVVSFADLDQADVAHAPEWVTPWGLGRPRLMGIREVTSPEETMASLGGSLQGFEPSQRPSWWQDYARSVPRVLARARPLAELQAKHPSQSILLDRAVADAMANVQTGETVDPAALRWLPLVSRKVDDWVVLLDPATARARGFAHLDGF